MPEFKENIPSAHIEDKQGEGSEESWVKYLKEKISETVDTWRERNKCPPIDIEIYFGSHKGALEFKRFANHLHDADIFIPEVYGWFGIQQKYYRKVAAGKMTPEQFEARMTKKSEFWEHTKAMLESIYNSKIAIGFADVDAYSAKKFKKNDKHSLDKYDSDFRFDFEVTPNMSKEDLLDLIEERKAEPTLYWQNFVDQQERRENQIVENLPHTIEEVFKAYPALKKKERVRVLLKLGTFHTRVAHLLKKNTNNVNMNFAKMPHQFSYTLELIRRLHFDKPLDDSFILHLWLEALLRNYYSREKLGETSDDAEILLRKIGKQFADEEIINIFINQKDVSSSAIRARIKQKLKEKNIDIQ